MPQARNNPVVCGETRTGGHSWQPRVSLFVAEGDMRARPVGDEASRKPSEQGSLLSRFSGERRRRLRTVTPGEQVAAGIQQNKAPANAGALFCSHSCVYLLPQTYSVKARSALDLKHDGGKRRCRRYETILWIVSRRERADTCGSPEEERSGVLGSRVNGDTKRRLRTERESR